MEPFKPKSEEEIIIDSIVAKDVIKKRLNKPRKEVKFTWKGLAEAVAGFGGGPFNPFRLKRLHE